MVAGCSALLLVGCSGGPSSSSVALQPLPPPQTQSVCATPATANPAGGGGIDSQIQIDPAVYGTADSSKWTVFGFSQEDPYLAGDSQVFAVLPDIVPRAWTHWDKDGRQASDYNFAYPSQARAHTITFIGGTTATALFPDEFPVASDLNAVVSCNAQGQPVPHAPLNFYRGSLASPKYRQYILGIAELQIDGGVDGVFFDEVDQSYEGVTYNDGNEGFDDADVADFGGFLCAKYSSLSAAAWQTQFSVTAADALNCTLALDQRGRAFDYRGYLARNGWQTAPLGSANPLAAEWGATYSGHPEPKNGTFTGTYTSLVYWQDIVLRLRQYARVKYGREIYVTANGIFPFVDFQSNGLWDGNPDGPNGTSVDYCPVTGDGHLDGTRSLLQAFLNNKQRSARIVGRIVPVSLFIDWPTGVMSRYLALPSSEQQDYWRMYVPEALAAGVSLNLHLMDTVGDPTAKQLGLIPLFAQISSFYRDPAHALLYHNATDAAGTVTVSALKITANLTRLSDGRTIAHLINHNYARAFQEQDAVQVAFPVALAPTSVTLISPDAAGDEAVAFTYSGGQVHVTVPKLISYVALVAK